MKKTVKRKRRSRNIIVGGGQNNNLRFSSFRGETNKHSFFNRTRNEAQKKSVPLSWPGRNNGLSRFAHFPHGPNTWPVRLVFILYRSCIIYYIIYIIPFVYNILYYLYYTFVPVYSSTTATTVHTLSDRRVAICPVLFSRIFRAFGAFGPYERPDNLARPICNTF